MEAHTLNGIPNGVQALSLGESGAPVLRQKRSQRFTVSTHSPSPSATTGPNLAAGISPAFVQDGRLNMPRDVDSLGSSDSSSSNAFMPLTPAAFASPVYSTHSPMPFPARGRTQSSEPWSRAAVLPPSWLSDPEYSPAPQQPPYQPPGPSPGAHTLNGFPLPGQETEDDEVIPTAIVIKNIPFSVRRETVLALMEDLHIPPPHAMNYHVDNGQFRGLAFANFRHPFEADAALAALNGYDLQGRRLRVEYKRVLRAGEKERIERDKAIKRMRSAVGFPQGIPPSMIPQAMPSAPPVLGSLVEAPRRQQSLYEDYEEYTTPPLPPNTSTMPPQQAYAVPPVPPLPPQPSASFNSVGMGLIGSPPSDSGVSSSGSASLERSPSAPLPDRPLAAGPTAKAELDMNDPQTLEIYSRVLLFKDDSLRDELAFARSLSPPQRRVVHLVAQKLALEAASIGDGDQRHVVVYKPGARPSSSASVTRSSSRGDLRGKKSAPDLRTRRSAANIRSLGGSPAPPVPPSGQTSEVTRQPRGPDDASNGFTARRARPQSEISSTHVLDER